MATSIVDAHLEISPENEIVFTLKETEGSPKVSLTLKHPDSESGPIAFKVKTTQPRRYLVRPNQGLIEPGGSEVVQILLVEKDKTQLLQSYKSLGLAALENCRDKFLVQSTVPADPTSLKDYENLTAFWGKVQHGGGGSAVANKKLHVRHRVADGSQSKGSATPARNMTNVEGMNKDQLVTEINSLRRKYDELVAFSVNLTAERDMLNNALEQTKRELQSERNGATPRGSRGQIAVAPSKSSMASYFLFALLLGILAGAKLQEMGAMDKVLASFGDEEEL